jgi:hypothetical protein
MIKRNEPDWIRRLLLAQLKDFMSTDRLYIAVLHESLISCVAENVLECLDEVLRDNSRIYITPVTGKTLSTNTFVEPIPINAHKDPVVVGIPVILYITSMEHKAQLRRIIDEHADTDIDEK